MTVKELKEAIADLPDGMEVHLSRDPEGNGYSPLHILDAAAYSDGDGGMYYEEHGWDGNGFDSQKDWDEYKADLQPVLVLSP
jgi:hypothetical protein